jgi:tetratricopeptide (TPR) repeat protein
VSRLAVLIGLGLFLLVDVGVAGSVEDRSWLRMKGDAFTLYSSVDELKTRQIFRELQLYYAVFHIIANVRPKKPPAPVNIYAFKTGWDADRFGKGGFYSAQAGVALGEVHVRYLGTREYLSYELKVAYARHLLLTNSRTKYPLWYEVGLTEYLGAVYQRNSIFMLGVRRPVIFRQRGNWTSIQALLEPAPASLHGGLPMGFKSGSWALFHYLNHADGASPASFAAGLGRYMRLRKESTDELTSFESSFSVEIEGLVDKMKHFHYSEDFVAPTVGLKDWMKPEELPDSEPLSRTEAAWYLGRTAMAVDQRKEALRLFKVALSESGSPRRAAITCSTARLELESDERMDESIRKIEQQLRTVPTNAECQLQLAELELLRAEAAVAGPAVEQAAQRVRTITQNLVKDDPELLKAFVLFARSYLLPGQDARRAIEILRYVLDRAGDELGTRRYLSLALEATDQCQEAQAELVHILAWAGRYDSLRKPVKQQLKHLLANCSTNSAGGPSR